MRPDDHRIDQGLGMLRHIGKELQSPWFTRVFEDFQFWYLSIDLPESALSRLRNH